VLAAGAGLFFSRYVPGPGGVYPRDAAELDLREESVSAADFAAHVGRALHCKGVRYLPGNRPIRTVAVCGGAGGNSADCGHVLRAGCDAYVTAEVKYPVSLEMAYAGLTIVDAGHFHTENPVLDRLEELIGRRLPALVLLRSGHDDPMNYLTF